MDLFAFRLIRQKGQNFFWCVVGGNWRTNIAIIAQIIVVFSIRVAISLILPLAEKFGFFLPPPPNVKKELSNTFFPRESFQLLLGFRFFPSLHPAGSTASSDMCFFFSFLGHSLSKTAMFGPF